MTTAARNPATIAREVLDAVKVMDDAPGLMYLDGPTHECEKAASSILDAAPDLARAVIDLTDKLATRDAQAERVEAQAQAWEAAASMIEAHGGDTETIRDMLQDLRTALNGETHG